jgi:hypothetical protein
MLHVLLPLSHLQLCQFTVRESDTEGPAENKRLSSIAVHMLNMGIFAIVCAFVYWLVIRHLAFAFLSTLLVIVLSCDLEAALPISRYAAAARLH